MASKFRVDPKQPNFPTTAMRRKKSATEMKTDRINRRGDRFSVQRILHEAVEPVKNVRAQKVETWKAERDKRNALKKKKPFVVGVVHHHAGSPYSKKLPLKQSIPNTLHSKMLADAKVDSAVKVPPVLGRVTRAMSKAQKLPDTNRKAKYTNELAPSNYKFKAPKGISAIPMETKVISEDLCLLFPHFQAAEENAFKGSENQSTKKVTSSPGQSRKPLSAKKAIVVPADDSPLPDATPHQKRTDLSVYRVELEKVVEQLQSLCNEWSSVAEKNSNIHTDNVDSISVAVGQTKLLIREKIAQYRGLINECEANTGQVPVTETDLKGFWDMVNLQVNDVISKFEKLTVLKENNWIENRGQQNSPVKRRKTAAPKPKQKPVKSSVRDHIAALRRAKAASQDSEPKVTDLSPCAETPTRVLHVTPSNMKENVRHDTPVVALTRMRVSENWQKTRRSSTVLMKVTNPIKELQTPERLSKFQSHI